VQNLEENKVGGIDEDGKLVVTVQTLLNLVNEFGDTFLKY